MKYLVAPLCLVMQVIILAISVWATYFWWHADKPCAAFFQGSVAILGCYLTLDTYRIARLHLQLRKLQHG